MALSKGKASWKGSHSGILVLFGGCLIFSYFAVVPRLLSAKSPLYISSDYFSAIFQHLVPETSKIKFTDERKALYQYHKASPRYFEQRNQPLICGEGPEYKKFFGLDDIQHSGSKEDSMIYDLVFKGMPKGNHSQMRYLELGDFNGREESNTRFFDECLGWEGVLIEPNPVVYNELVQFRPNAHKLRFAALCNSSEEAQNKTVGFWKSRYTNSVQDDSVENRKAYAFHPNSKMVQVPCGRLTAPLQEILKPHNRIHYFRLDVEGMEPNVLKTLDFDKIFVDIFTVENTNIHCKEICESRDRVRAIMKKQNYILYSRVIKRSDLYIHPRSPFYSAFEQKMPTETNKINVSSV